jgi:hypothetical protein
MDFVKLSDQITDYFNADELADLSFRLGIPIENVAGVTHPARVRELTDYCRRHGRLEELVSACRQLRPHVLWTTPQAAPIVQNQPGELGSAPPSQTGANVPTMMPGNVQPPQVPGMFWMAYPNTWYGPFYGFYIGWMAMGGFQVWHPMAGPTVYPDLYHQMQRNVWVRLFNSPFNVFVDGGPTGYVFGQYSPL